MNKKFEAPYTPQNIFGAKPEVINRNFLLKLNLLNHAIYEVYVEFYRLNLNQNQDCECKKCYQSAWEAIFDLKRTLAHFEKIINCQIKKPTNFEIFEDTNGK
jgi:hypothetical protein